MQAKDFKTIYSHLLVNAALLSCSSKVTDQKKNSILHIKTNPTAQKHIQAKIAI